MSRAGRSKQGGGDYWNEHARRDVCLYDNKSALRKSHYLIDLEDLAVGFLDAIKHRHVVPEAGLGHNGVGSEDVHLVDGRLTGSLLRGRLQSTNHL